MGIRMSYFLNICPKLAVIYICIVCSCILCLLSKMLYRLGTITHVYFLLNIPWLFLFTLTVSCWQLCSFKVWFFWEREWRKTRRNWREEKGSCCFKASCHFASVPSKADEGGCRTDASTKERDNHLCQHDWTSEADPGSLGSKNIW